jgi:hypothetical protein
MTELSKKLKQKLLAILKDEYEDCRFFMAASNILTNKISDLSETIQNDNLNFNELRDSIGEIGLFLSNTEKRLQEVEDCYTKLVEILAEEKPK